MLLPMMLNMRQMLAAAAAMYGGDGDNHKTQNAPTDNLGMHWKCGNTAALAKHRTLDNPPPPQTS